MTDTALAGELAAACGRLGLDVQPAAMQRLAVYAASLWSWNERLNLTRHTTPDSFVARDVADAAALEIGRAHV